MFARGYKSWCENTSLSFRKKIGLKNSDPLIPHDLANYLNVKLKTPSDIVGLSENSKKQLLGECHSSWSAVTVCSNHSALIIYNPRHSAARQSNTLMHELAHIIIGHSPSHTMYSVEIGSALRQYNQKQEEEANWLAGTLLLPREALIAIRSSALTDQETCREYIVSKQLLKMRLNLTGVNKMFARTKKRGRI